MTGFDEVVKMLFGDKYDSYISHPMYQYLSRFSYSMTPNTKQDDFEASIDNTIK